MILTDEKGQEWVTTDGTTSKRGTIDAVDYWYPRLRKVPKCHSPYWKEPRRGDTTGGKKGAGTS